ncbi:hypothetical protein QZH41_002675 [Actinostola sp. cb2023]|nr:hypothetical protein QZH41_002675 [Actinostola sp. cb2023]
MHARYYGEYPAATGKACELDPISPINRAPGWINVAASKDDFLKSVGCGMCIEIQGDGTPVTDATVGTPVKGPLKATIVDICGGCKQGDYNFLQALLSP